MIAKPIGCDLIRAIKKAGSLGRHHERNILNTAPIGGCLDQ
jgi:hypothetical protein